MLKNRNIRFGFFVFLFTLLGLLLYAEYSKPSKENLSEIKQIESKNLAIKH